MSASPLARLDGLAEGLANAVFDAHRWADEQQRAHPTPSRVIKLGHIRTHWRVLVGGDETRVVLFFFRQKDQVVKMDVRLEIEVAPSSYGATRKPMQFELTDTELIVRSPTPEDLQRHTAGRTSAHDTCLFRLEDGAVLAIQQQGDHERLWYTKQGQGAVRLEPLDDLWDLQPLLEMARALKRLTIGSRTTLDAIPLSNFGRGSETQATSVLRKLAGLYHTVSHGLETTEHDVAALRLDARLRINPDGTLATPENEDDPFSLSTRLEIESGDDVVTAKLTPGPPEFLVQGELHGAFIEALEKRAGTIIEEFQDANRIGTVTLETLEALLAQGSSAIIFRTHKNADVDRDVVILESDRGPVMVLTVDARVNTTANPPTVKLRKIRAIYYGPSRHGLAPSELVEYIGRFAEGVRTWLAVLGSER